MEKFRYLLAGTGDIASSYVKAIANVPELTLAGFVSRTARRPAGADPRLPVYSSISSASNYDAVILALPNGCHAAACLEAVRAGKHVFTEKTLALTRCDMDAMINACKAKNLQLGVAFQRRTEKDNIAVHDLLARRAFGRVFACELKVNFWRPQEYYSNSSYRGTFALDGGGPFVQQASHNLDIYTWFFGLPDKIHAFTGTFMHQMEGEDYGVAILRHPDGMLGTITASTACKPGFPPQMTIYTEKGSLVLTSDKITAWHVEGIPNPAVDPEKQTHVGASDNLVTNTRGHEILLKDFAGHCISGGKVMVSGEDARAATELILRIYEVANRP